MKLAVITNQDLECGNAAYGFALAHEMRMSLMGGGPHQVDVYSGDELIVNKYRNGGAHYDVVFINWHPAVVHTSVNQVKMLQATGAKVVLIHQNTDGQGDLLISQHDILWVCDGVVVHERMSLYTLTAGRKDLTYIPHGIPQVDLSRQTAVVNRDELCKPLIGTAGFPFPWKRPDVVFKAAVNTGGTAVVFFPPYQNWQWETQYPWIRMAPANLKPIFGWHLSDVVIRTLAQCDLNIFWFDSKDIHDQFGQTGSARMGIAAQKPMIISRHRKFRTLIEEFGPEFYIADTEEDVYRLTVEILATPEEERRRPVQCLKVQGWSWAAMKYLQLAENLCGGKNDSV